MKKHHSGIISIKTGMRQAEKERKKKFCPEFRSYPGKKTPKKFQEIKKNHSGIISIKTGMRWAEKEKIKFQSRIPFLLNLGKKIPKKIAKNFKN